MNEQQGYGEGSRGLSSENFSHPSPRRLPLPTLCYVEPVLEMHASHGVHASLIEELGQHLDITTASTALVIGQAPRILVEELVELPLLVDILPYGEEAIGGLNSPISEHSNVSCLEGDFETLDLDGSSYDLIIAMNSWHQMTQGIRSAKAARLLRWGGGLIACCSKACVTDAALGHDLHVALRSESDCAESGCGDHRLWGDHDIDQSIGDFDELRSSALFSRVDEFEVTHEWDCDQEQFTALLGQFMATTDGNGSTAHAIDSSRVENFFSDHGLSSLSFQSSAKAYVALL